MPVIRVAWISDLHCGSPVGLTHNPQNVVQERLYDAYVKSISWFGEPPDYLVVDGDISEGTARFLDFSNPLMVSQLEDAGRLLSLWCPKKETIIITGTVVHSTLELQDMEKVAAKEMQLALGGHKVTITHKLKTTFNGWFLCQARHFIGRSIIPHGRATAPLRSQLWQDLNSFLNSVEQQEPALRTHLHVFGHVHYWTYVENNRGAVVTLPAWKALGDKYGDQVCDGSIDLGVFKTEIGETEDEGWTWDRLLFRPGVVSRLQHR